jgi:hypothetical protein
MVFEEEELKVQALQMSQIGQAKEETAEGSPCAFFGNFCAGNPIHERGLFLWRGWRVSDKEVLLSTHWSLRKENEAKLTIFNPKVIFVRLNEHLIPLNMHNGTRRVKGKKLNLPVLPRLFGVKLPGVKACRFMPDVVGLPKGSICGW